MRQYKTQWSFDSVSRQVLIKSGLPLHTIKTVGSLQPGCRFMAIWEYGCTSFVDDDSGTKGSYVELLNLRESE